MADARVLIVAGSDSGGGAGIQADIKTVSALRGYAATAVTALTAQNTRGVQDVWPVPVPFIVAQMRSVLDDIGADCVKTGMLHDVAVIEAITEVLAFEAVNTPLVVDPVMIAQSGDRLLHDSGVAALRERLAPLATVLTPNLPEAEVLLGWHISTLNQRIAASEVLLELGCGAVVLKGGHAAEGDEVTDVLATVQGVQCISYPRLRTANNHGTGCTLASAIATGIAQGLPPERAVRRARRYLQRALETATPLGGGQGPVNHRHTVMAFDEGEA